MHVVLAGDELVEVVELFRERMCGLVDVVNEASVIDEFVAYVDVDVVLV